MCKNNNLTMTSNMIYSTTTQKTSFNTSWLKFIIIILLEDRQNCRLEIETRLLKTRALGNPAILPNPKSGFKSSWNPGFRLVFQLRSVHFNSRSCNSVMHFSVVIVHKTIKCIFLLFLWQIDYRAESYILFTVVGVTGPRSLPQQMDFAIEQSMHGQSSLNLCSSNNF